MSVDDASILAHTVNPAGRGSTSSYFVPRAAYDQFTIAAKTPPKSWRCASGATEMELQRYGTVMEVTAAFTPYFVIMNWTSNQPYEFVSCTLTITNLTDSTITVDYDIPANCTSFLVLEPGFAIGNSALSTAGVAGSKVIAPFGTESIVFGAVLHMYDGDQYYKKVRFPGSILSLGGESWGKETIANVFWGSGAD